MKIQASKLQKGIRSWLRETRLRRFVRDVVKLSKLSKIYERTKGRHRFKDWFERSKRGRLFTSLEKKGEKIKSKPVRKNSSMSPVE